MTADARADDRDDSGGRSFGNRTAAGEKAAIIAAQKDPMNLSGAIFWTGSESSWRPLCVPRTSKTQVEVCKHLPWHTKFYPMISYDIGTRWTRIADI